MSAPASTTLTLPASLYLVAWTGGFEDPSFQAFTTEATARETYQAWVAAAHDRSDRITFVEQSLSADGVVTTVKIDEHCPSWGDDDED